MKVGNRTRVISALMAIVLAIGMMPLPAFAGETGGQLMIGSGSLTAQSYGPYYYIDQYDNGYSYPIDSDAFSDIVDSTKTLDENTSSWWIPSCW